MLGEQAVEVAGAGMRLVRQGLGRPVRGRVAQDGVLHPVHAGVQVVAVIQPGRERRVAAGAAQVHHHFARHGAGHARAAVTRHEVEGQVDAGGDAGAGPDPGRFDEDTVFEHPGIGRQGAQRIQAAVVAGAVAAGEQAGGGQHQGPGADGHDVKAVGRRAPRQPVDEGAAVGAVQRVFGADQAADHDQGMGRQALGQRRQPR